MLDHDQLRQLHGRGLSCAAIARELGVARSTVSRACAKLGLLFDRAQTKQATAAKVADAKARRATLSLNYLGDAERLREQLWEPHTYRDHGGRDFVEARWTQNEPTPADKLKLMQASTLAADKSIRIEQHDSDTQGLAAVDEWLRDVMGG